MRKLIWMTLFIAGTASAADAPAPAAASAPSAAAVADMLKAARLSFDVDWNGIPLGTASINLVPEGKGCYRYESKTDPVGPVRWLYGSPYEVSEFCVKDGVIRPNHYKYSIDKRAKDGFTLDFDWTAKKVTAVKEGKTTVRDLPDIAYDRFGLQQAIRLWVISLPDTTKRSEAEFVSVDNKDINHYRFAVLGHEKVETSVGTIDAIRIDRIDSKTRSTHSWVAPSRDFQVIKLESVNRGDVELKMVTNK
jgi:hypothetical protein